MCLAAWAIGQHPRWPWVLVSNRDEFFDRPAAPLAWWQPEPGAAALLSGRDLSAGGTWMGLNARGRLALVTNVREPGRTPPPQAPSRGALVTQALQQPAPDAAWLAAVAAVPRSGFNLVVADLAGLQAQWVSNRAAAPRPMGAGVHGVSNAALDTPWPKLRLLKHRLAVALRDPDASADRLLPRLWAAMSDAEPADDAQLPATGLPLARERQLSSAFIHIPAAPAEGAAQAAQAHAPGSPVGRSYGTRCSSVVLVTQDPQGGRQVQVWERRFNAQGLADGESQAAFKLL